MARVEFPGIFYKVRSYRILDIAITLKVFRESSVVDESIYAPKGKWPLPMKPSMRRIFVPPPPIVCYPLSLAPASVAMKLS